MFTRHLESGPLLPPQTMCAISIINTTKIFGRINTISEDPCKLLHICLYKSRIHAFCRSRFGSALPNVTKNFILRDNFGSDPQHWLSPPLTKVTWE